MKIIGLDVGARRIGLAVADAAVRIAIPDCTIEVDGSELDQIYQIAKSYRTALFVIGLPRNVAGQETAQSRFVRQFATALQDYIPEAKVKFQDETLTSVEAEKRLSERKRNYQKSEIDAEAAAIILQDFIENFKADLEARPAKSARNTTGIKSSRAKSANSADSHVHKHNAPQTVSQPRRAVAAAKPVSDTTTAKTTALAAASVQATKNSMPTPVSTKKNASQARPQPRKALAPAKSLADTDYASHTASAPSQTPKIANSTSSQPTKTADSAKPKTKKRTLAIVASVLLVLLIIIGAGSFLAYGWYNDSLTAVVLAPECQNSNSPDCQKIEFVIAEGESSRQIGDNLEAAGLIRSSLAFQLYLRFHNEENSLKPGTYSLDKSRSVEELVKTFQEGVVESNVFRITFLPGDSLKTVKQKLVEKGYTKEVVEAAFAKKYDHPVLADKPEDASLEGYIYGETYEFYKGESVENIILTALNQLYKVVQDNNLVSAYQAQGLNLYQGITLASIVQKEATSDAQPTVAQVFLSRLAQGMALGSDVTTQYALDLIDPERTTYTDNALALTVDSPYNTRKYTGLPPGPISNPGQSALLAVAHPSSTSYLFFLTGDDGMMYYSSTEAEHQQNIASHCKELCNAKL